METQIMHRLRGRKRQEWEALLRRCGLEPDENWDRTILLLDGEELAAAGSRLGNLLKCIAVDQAHQGDGLAATLLTALRQDAFGEGLDHLFLYTKPGNEFLFSTLFFHPVARTDRVVLMENRKDGVLQFLSTLPACPTGGSVGALVMNCDPFTLGHRHLVETAAEECDQVYVFVLSEDRGHFRAGDRLELVRRGTGDLPNVTVLPTGPYLISAATFPTYFLKDRDAAGEVQCQLDIEIFLKYYVPHFGITRRYVGTEPLSPMTNRYNETLRQHLPLHGVELREIPRLCRDGIPISASAVRALAAEQNFDALRALVPETTLEFLQKQEVIL